MSQLNQFITLDNLKVWFEKVKSMPKEEQKKHTSFIKSEIERFKMMKQHPSPVCVLCSDTSKPVDTHILNLFFEGTVHENCYKQWSIENREEIVKKYNL